MKYVLPIIATLGLGCSPAAYEPTNLETEILNSLPGEELVTKDWQIYQECGNDDSTVTCYRVFDGPNDEFFSINVDKWSNKNLFALEVDGKIAKYELENEKCPEHLTQRFVLNHPNNTLITIYSDEQDFYSADNLADYVAKK
jgi:hypothetical protein